jgi:TPR repeat protein
MQTIYCRVEQGVKEELDVCCICLDELSHNPHKNARTSCCEKQWHWDCHNTVQNSSMPDNLKHRCHHCRKPFSETEEEEIKRIRNWVHQGKAWAQRGMAIWYCTGTYGNIKQSYVMAAMLYGKAIAQGDPVAMYDLACLYRDGVGVVQSFRKGVELYTMSVEQGYFKAMFSLACMYRDGTGVVKSLKKAAELYTMAAEQGHDYAMFNLGVLYQDGEGVAQSFKKAAELYTMAAEKGIAAAMYYLGYMYIRGEGVDQSKEVAREWWTKAADEGLEHAITALETLDLLDKHQGSCKQTTTTATTTTTASPSPICCSSCNKPQPSTRKFQQCTGCHTVQYCNKECQRGHWKTGGHKQACKRLKKNREDKKGSGSST